MPYASTVVEIRALAFALAALEHDALERLRVSALISWRLQEINGAEDLRAAHAKLNALIERKTISTK